MTVFYFPKYLQNLYPINNHQRYAYNKNRSKDGFVVFCKPIRKIDIEIVTIFRSVSRCKRNKRTSPSIKQKHQDFYSKQSYRNK